MVVGAKPEGSRSSENASSSRKKQPLGAAAASSPSKNSSPQSTSSLLLECVAGETAQPEKGVSVTERRVWGEIFQSRQNFVDMHCC